MGATKTKTTTIDLATENQELTPKKQKLAKVRGKKYLANKLKVDRNKLYDITSAIELAKTTSYSKFDGTIELHLVVKKEGINVNVVLPHATGKTKKVEVATDATLEKLKTGKIDFDVLLQSQFE